MRNALERGVVGREWSRSCSRIASCVPKYRVLEVAGVTILTASMGLDAMELDTL